MPPDYDVAVIGAGMAGMTVARLLAEAGRSVVLLEARDRVGGRVLTAHSTHGSIVELGAEFVHGKPKPTLALAHDARITLLPLGDRHFAKHGLSFRESPDPWQPLASVLELSNACDPDSSAQAFLKQHQIAPKTVERFRQLIEGFEAAPIDQVSIQSLAEDSEALTDDDSQFRVEGGYGQLVQHAREGAISAGATLLLSSAVAGVRWTDGERVTLHFETEQSQLDARCCVVAVPLGVLQAPPEDHGIAFDPPLTAWQPALDHLAMGHACRVVLDFRGLLALDGVPSDAFVHHPTSLFETFWAQHTQDSTLWTAWAGGPKAIELARETSEMRQRLALGALAALFDVPESKLQQTLCGVHHHDFSNDPRARGAYSYCRPGGAKASAALSSPLGKVLFLAGEATDHEYPGTVAGAISSGQRAAKQVLAALER